MTSAKIRLYHEGIAKFRDHFMENVHEWYLLTKRMSERSERVSFQIRKNEWIKTVQRQSATSGEMKKNHFASSTLCHRSRNFKWRKEAGRKRSERRRAEGSDLPISPSHHKKHYHFTRHTPLIGPWPLLTTFDLFRTSWEPQPCTSCDNSCYTLESKNWFSWK